MYEINQTLMIKANTKNIKSINESQTRAAYTNIDVEFERDFCVYDLYDFISTLSIIKDPVIDLSNNKFAIISSQDGTKKLKYYETNPDLITSYFSQEFKLKNEDVKINVKRTDIKDIMKATSTLSLKYISLVGDGEKIFIKAFNSRKGDNKETNSFIIEIGKTNFVFDLIYESKMLSMIDEDVEFTFARDKKSRLSIINCGDIVYWVGIDINSKMEV